MWKPFCFNRFKLQAQSRKLYLKKSKTGHETLSQELCNYRLQQAHMFRPPDRQPIYTKMADHFRNRVKWFTELPQNVALITAVFLYPHMHKTSSAPKK